MSIENHLSAFNNECDLIAAKAATFRDNSLQAKDSPAIDHADTLGLLNDALSFSFRQMSADLQAVDAAGDRPPPLQGDEP